MSTYKFFMMILIISILLLSFLSCIGPITISQGEYKIVDNFDKLKYKKVGLLVNRMANKMPCPPAQITLETDYSICIPKVISTPTYYGLKYSEIIDVFIEDQNRLTSSCQFYPYYGDSRFIKLLMKEETNRKEMGFSVKTKDLIDELRKKFKKDLRDCQCYKFYGNISKQIYDSIEQLLTDKGYSVVDVRKLSTHWNKPISELTVNKIISYLSDSVDALVIFHYKDIGYQYEADYDKKSIVSPDWESTKEITGFSDLPYTLSLFDVSSNKRILWYELPSLKFYDIIEQSGEIVKTMGDYTENYYKYNFTSFYIGSLLQRYEEKREREIRHKLSNDELIQYALKIMRYGYVGHGIYDFNKNNTYKWIGLEEVIP